MTFVGFFYGFPSFCHLLSFFFGGGGGVTKSMCNNDVFNLHKHVNCEP